eukprot:453114-Amorphochlora_amoeboformis.AAC.1
MMCAQLSANIRILVSRLWQNEVKVKEEVEGPKTLISRGSSPVLPSDPLVEAKFLDQTARAMALLQILMGTEEPRREGARIVTENNGEVVTGTIMSINTPKQPTNKNKKKV